ncbi:PREDICTED: mannose/glucose-specific lectin-like [Ipomoea nil]|uniref:mannose/glucose-specific lectin-like n=1 Tax=Ipomoea nil TaxID=35883 RepID=UPI00090167FF|nr:PREDICTED: mannose/glucose-specific lectin-like [Ipomoea nil]
MAIPTDVVSGPLGNSGGDFWSFRPTNKINKIVILFGGSGNNNPIGITFSCIKNDGSKETITVGGGGTDTIVTRTDTVVIDGTDEYLTEVSGTFGPFIDSSYSVLRSIKFTTNVRVFGPYGPDVGTPFSFQPPDGTKISGFIGRAGIYVDAIGIYSAPY